MKKIVFSEKTNEAIPKKLPDGQVQTHRTLPFQKNRASKKELKSELTHTHVHKHTNMHGHTHTESHILKYSNWSNTTWSDLPCFWMVHRSLSLSSLSYYFHDLTSHNLLNKWKKTCINYVFINHNFELILAKFRYFPTLPLQKAKFTTRYKVSEFRCLVVYCK